jgi:hypothetical protein
VSFAIGALRAIVEMIGLCLIAQGVLHVVAGRARPTNFIYQFFALVTHGPRRLTARLLPQGCSGILIGFITFAGLFAIWIGLAVLRKFL